MPNSDALRQNRTGPGIAAALFLLASGSISLAASWNVVNPMDFYQFWFVTRTNLHDIERPYSADAQAALSAVAEQRLESGAIGPLETRTLEKTRTVFRPLADGRMIQSTGTPLLYATIALISTDSFEVTARIAQAFVTLAYVAMFLFIGCAFRLSAIAVVASWTVLWTCLAPACFDVYFVNVSGLQTCMLVAVVWLISTKRLALAGFIAAYAALFKPTAAYPVVALTVFLAFQNDWRAMGRFVAGGLSGGVAAAMVTAWAFGTPGVWVDWVTLMLPEVAETTYSVVRGNYGLNPLLLEYGSVRPTGILTAIIFLPVLVFAASRGWRTRKARSAKFSDPFWVMSAASAAMLLSAPLTWLHYYMLVLPAIMVLACRPGIRDRVFAALFVAGYSQLSFIQLPNDVEIVRATLSASLFTLTTVGVLTISCRELGPANGWTLFVRDAVSSIASRFTAIRPVSAT